MGIHAVTGAASGIGRAIAEQLRAGGHEVITVDVRDADIVADLSDARRCEEVVAEIVRESPGVWMVSCPARELARRRLTSNGFHS